MNEIRKLSEVTDEELFALVPPAFKGTLEYPTPLNAGTSAYEDGSNRYTITVEAEGLPGTWPKATSFNCLGRVTRLARSLGRSYGALVSGPHGESFISSALTSNLVERAVKTLNDDGRVQETADAELAAHYENDLRERINGIREVLADAFDVLEVNQACTCYISTPGYRAAREYLATACADLCISPTLQL